jgi:hypothetical protein
MLLRKMMLTTRQQRKHRSSIKMRKKTKLKSLKILKLGLLSTGKGGVVMLRVGTLKHRLIEVTTCSSNSDSKKNKIS